MHYPPIFERKYWNVCWISIKILCQYREGRIRLPIEESGPLFIRWM